MRLKDKIALVTGASRGIGRAIACGFAREGAHVALNSHDDDGNLRAAAGEVRALGREALACDADVSRREAVESMVRSVVDKFGRLDILVNNAGIAIWRPFLEIAEEDWDRTLDVNLKGAFLCSQAVAREMVRKGSGGSIVNISSIAAHAALDCLVPYCASKGGMTLATRSMAVELAPHGIRVNALAPGTIAVERNFATDPDYPGNWEPFIPLGRVGDVEEIVRPAVFLASEEASYITGQTIFADGGQSAYMPMPRAQFARRA